MSKEFINSVPRKGLGKDVSHIFSSGTIVQSDELTSNKLMNKMVVNLNVFSPAWKEEFCTNA